MYHHTPAGQTGPLVRRLQSYGKLESLVVSPGGRAARATKARSMGREASDKELGIIVSQVRK